MKSFKEIVTDEINEGVTFKGMEKKCLAMQKALEKFNDALLDFQDIEDDRPQAASAAKAIYKVRDDMNNKVETLRTILRKGEI